MDKWNNRNSYDWLAGAVVGLLTGFFIGSCGCEVRPVIFSVDIVRNLE